MVQSAQHPSSSSKKTRRLSGESCIPIPSRRAFIRRPSSVGSVRQTSTSLSSLPNCFGSTAPVNGVTTPESASQGRPSTRSSAKLRSSSSPIVNRASRQKPEVLPPKSHDPNQSTNSSTNNNNKNTQQNTSTTPDRSQRKSGSYSPVLFSPNSSEIEEAPTPAPFTPHSLDASQQARLEASLVMLREAMGEDEAKAYEYMFNSGNSPFNNMPDPLLEETVTEKPWLSFVHRIHSKHKQKTSQLRKDLHLSEAKKKQYKAQLRENLTERLKFLEDRMLQSQLQNLSATSSMHGSFATGATSQLTEEETITPSVVYESENEWKQRLEAKEIEFAREKREWSRRFDALGGRYAQDLDSWQKEVTKLKDDSRRFLAERNQLQAQNSLLQTKLDQSIKDRTDTLNVLEELEKEYHLSQQQLHEAQHREQEAKKSAKEVKRLCREELMALDSPIADVEAEFTATLQERQELTARLRQVEQQHAEDRATWKLQLESALANARHTAAEMGKAEASHQGAIKRLTQSSKEQLEKTREEMRNEMQQEFDIAMLDRQKRVEELEAQVMQLEQRNDQMERQISTLHKENANLCEQKNLLEHEKENLTNKLNVLEKEVTKATSKMADQAEETRRNVSRVSDQLEQALREHSREVQTLKDQHRLELQTRLRQVELQHADEKKTWKLKLQSALADAQKIGAEKEKAEVTHQDAIKLLKQSMKEQLKAAGEEVRNKILKESRQELQTLKQDHQKCVEDLKAQVMQLEHGNEEHRHQIAILHQENTEMSELISGLEHEKETLTGELDDLEVQIEKAASEMADQAAEASLNVSRISGQLEQTRQEHLREINAVKDDHRHELQRLVEEKEQLASAFASLETEISVWKRRCLELEPALEESQLTQTKYLEELSEWRETANNLQRKVQDLIESESCSAEKYQHELDLLKANCSSLARKMKNLELENDSLHSKSASLQVEMAERESSAVLAVERKFKILQQENEALRATNEGMTVHIFKANKDCDERMSALESLHKRTLDALEQKHDEQHEKTKQVFAAKEEKHKKHIADLERQVLEKEEEWQKKAKAYQDEVEAMRYERKQADELSKGNEESWTAKLEAYQEQVKGLELQLARADSTAQAHIYQSQQEGVQHAKETAELRLRLSNYESDYRKLEANHTREMQALIEAANKESKQLSEQTNMLANSLEEVNALHRKTTSQWEAEILRLEEENAKLQEEKTAAQAKSQEETVAMQRQIAACLEEYQKNISCAVLELRGDILSIREAVENPSIQHALVHPEVDGLKQSVDQIHSTICDALAEVTLETENLIECRNTIQQLVDKTRIFLEPNNGLRRQMSSLEKMLSKILTHDLKGSHIAASSPLKTCMAELFVVKDHLVKEQALRERAEKMSEVNAELVRWEKEQREKAEQKMASLEEQAGLLSVERKRRIKAENDVIKLHDQADAYGEEVMRLQEINSELHEKLKQAEHRIEGAVEKTEAAEAVPVCENHHSVVGELSSDDDSSPILDEALLLAQNLTALIQDQGNTGKEATVMEMLESISDLLDRPPNPSVVSVATPPKKRDLVFMDDYDEDPPIPIASPPVLHQAKPINKPVNDILAGGELTSVVEQLYWRCQMLERERTEIMEVTLDILQSAREASSAELEAALATARRKSAEELLRVREENQKGMWRLYHKLCGNCRNGLGSSVC